MNVLHRQNGDIILYDSFLAKKYADEIFNHLFSCLQWRQEELRMFGKSILSPRLVAWYGDQGTIYTYSGVEHTPLAWEPSLLHLKNRVTACVRRPFNSVLANLYRDQNDSMGWHSDAESELGLVPFIASLSLGETRLFKMQHKKTKQTLNINLVAGSLLIMGEGVQKYWRHCIPKTRKLKNPRINLTFRYIEK